MRRLAPSVATRTAQVALAACSFTPGTYPDGGSDGTRDMTGPDAPGLCGGKIWFADFSSDPTTYDNNGDSVNDWVARNPPFPTAQLVSGEWRVPSAGMTPLDMQPVQPFVTRVLVRTRMRGTATAGAHGAVFYINVARDSDSYAALFADAHLTGTNQQEVNFVNPIAGQGDTALGTVPGFTAAPIEIELDIDPLQLRFHYRINGGNKNGPVSFSASNMTTVAGFGTLVGYSTAAAFDEVYVEVCP